MGFYLDRQRVHVGDLAALTENLFDAWRADRSRGLDSVMLAPTRDLVAELNRRARTHRLASASTPGPEVALADGNAASAGELIVTRRNERQLRTSASDWVKNGDRWTVLTAHRDGGLRVQHGRSGRTIDLPASYVRDLVELGYATTIHTAQGITADTMHGLIAGTESRQQLYTMCTRGRLGNHIYLQLVGDGDPHTVIRPVTIPPATATELLEHILARDDTHDRPAPYCESSKNPAVRLGSSVERYIDAVHVAAEKVVGRSAVQGLEASANRLVPGLTDEPAWPTLRAHLLLLAVHGADPHQRLRAACDIRELISADDRAAVLNWRLDDTNLLSGRDGPLPWLPGIPDRIAADPTWGPYLDARSHLVAQLADQVRRNTAGETPAWAVQLHTLVPAELIPDLEVWRAAIQIDPGLGRTPNVPVLDPAIQESRAKRVAGAGRIDHRERLDVERKALPALADGHALTPSREHGHLEPLVQGQHCLIDGIDSSQQLPIFESGKNDVRTGKRPPRSLDANILNEAGGSRRHADEHPGSSTPVDQVPYACIAIHVQQNVAGKVQQPRAL